ncbi:MAG: hypothetical protein ACOYIB_04865 [Desulfosporosinus sp.]|jgi:hypothetical protein
MKKVFVLGLMVLTTLFLGGCAAFPSFLGSIPKMQFDKVTVIEDQSGQQNAQEESLNQVISDYIKKIAFKSIGGTVFEAHELYGTEDKDGKTFVYLWSYQQEFASENGELVRGAGLSVPMVLVLNKDGNGNYTVLEYKVPQDGERYASSVKQLFPEKYQEKILLQTNVNTLSQIVRQKAENYFNTSEESRQKDGDIITATGKYSGQIDSNSIEILIGAEEKAMAFRFSEGVKSKFDSYGLKQGDKVEITYAKNGYNQFILMSLKKQNNDQQPDSNETKVKTDSGRYNGQIDSNSIEIKISGVPDKMEPRVFRLSEPLKEKFNEYKLNSGDTIKFNYIVNEYGQTIITDLTILNRAN